MSDDEDWDKDFDIQAPVVPKLALPPRDNNDLPLNQRTPPPNIADLLQKDEDDEDWDNDFVDENEEAKPLKIIGMKAEPTNTENWDEFFVLPQNNDKGIGTLSERKTFTLNRIGSLISNIDRLDFFLKDVLQLFSDSKKAKDHEPEESWDDELEQETKEKKAANTKVEESKAVFELGRPTNFITYRLGMSDLNQENSLDAIKHFQAAHALLHGVPVDERDNSFEIELHYQTGLASKNTSQMLEATNHFKQAADSLSSGKLTEAQKLTKFRTNKELGICYDVSSNFSLACQSYGESVKAVMSLPAPETYSAEIAKICLQLGKCCQQLSGAVVDLSRDFVKKALEFSEKAGDNETKAAANEQLTKLKSSNASGEDERSTSSGTTELDELDSEDWDKEFGVDTDRQKLNLETMGSMLQKNASVAEPSPQGGAELPKRLRFLDNLKNDVEIVKFPKATFFYSGIKTKDGHRFLNEDALESWLQTLASKRASDLFQVKVSEMNYKNELEIKQKFVSKLQNSAKYSLDWAKIQYEYVLTLFALKKVELLWDTLFNVFVDLKDASAIIAKLKPNDQEVFMNLIMQMVYVASKMWSTENDHSFKDILKSVSTLHPKAKDLVSIVEVETIIHHKYHQLDDKGFIAQLQKLATVYNSVNSRCPGPHPTVTDYSKQSYSELDDLSVKVRALCNLHFIMNNLSPLTTHQQNVAYDENDPDNPDSARKNSTNSGSVESMNFNGSELLDPTVRMTILTGLYNSLPVCYLKAKAAFALAHHNYFEMESLGVAEQLLFESLYIMDILDSPVMGVFAVISELGTNALLRYAEVLLKNYKYVYAAASYESAIVNYKLRKRTGYDALLKKIATVTKDNDDNKRAIEYFREVLEMYYKEGKSNEIRYVSEMISSLYFEIGDFRKAEAFLSNALATVPQPAVPTDVPKIDPITFKLQMKLSDIYLDSYHYEKGIEVLQYMIRAILPHGSRPQVLEKLAKAYIKKRWFVEATTILDHLKIDLAGSQFSPASSSGSILGSSVDYSTSPSHHEGGFASSSSMNNNNNTTHLNAKLIKYWELSSVNYYNAGLFPQAIYCIDMAISSCPTTSLSSLARYFRIRGKIFQLLASPASSVQFPTTLQPSEKELFPPKANHPHRVYTCVGDLLQECVSNYNKAYTYFKAIGDDIRIAKTTASIAQTYLEHLFFPVAVVGLPYNELARLPSFEVSEIAKASSLKEKRGKGGGSSGRKKGILSHVKSVDKDFFISLEKIENPARCALDIAADTFNPILLAKSYLNMAELRYLQNDTEIAVAFWSECKELLFQMFITTDNVAVGPSSSHHYCGLLGKGAPPQAISKVYKLFKRLVRFLFCLDAEFINKNTVVIDVFLGLEYDLDHSQKRPTPSLIHAAADQQHAKVMESVEHSTSDSELKNEKPSSLGKSTSKHKPSTLPSLNSSILNTLNLTPQNTGVGTSNNFISGAMGLKAAPTQGARKSVASIFTSELEFEDMQRFSSKENMVAKTLEINEESAERIWGFLYLIQVQTTNYTKGKVAAEELLSRIKKTTRKILQVKRFNDAIKQTLLEITTSPVNSPNPKANLRRIPSMSAISFPKDQSTQELMKTTKALSKLMFAIQIDDHVIYYVPNNGEKRIQKIGGKDDYNTNQMNTFWYLTIHLMAAPDEYVMLVVNPNLSLDKLLKHLCNKAYWEHEDNKKKSFFGSFGKTTTPQVNKLKYVDRTKGFHGFFLELLTSLESESEPERSGSDSPSFKGKLWTSAELSRISFAKKVVSQDSTLSYVPLTVSTHTTVSQCFTIPETQEASAENPLALYMYLSSQTRNLTTLDIQRENINRTLYITKEMVNYFTSLVASQTTYESEQGKKVINDLIDNIVACVEDIIPYSNDKASPLILVSSKMLQIFPWELMFRESLTRHFSMQDVVVFLKKRAPKPNPQDEEAMVPKYYGCYYSGGDKHLMPVEEKRKDWILKEYFQRLKLRQKAPSNLHGLGYLPPLHCSLVKYGKKISAYKRTYRYMTWFDMAPVFTPDDLVRNVDSLTLAHYSIFVLSFADLLEANESVMYLMRTHPTCTFLFIPSSKMKLVVSKLMKVQEEAFSTKGKIKTQQTPAQFLSATLSALQTENSSPIAIINPVL